MKVIFTQTMKGVAFKGDVKTVKDGFYRNFLERRQMAIPATAAKLKEWEELRKKLMIEKEHIKSKLEETKKRLSSGALQIHKKVTAKGTLYGGVKTSDIAAAIADQLKMEVAPESIHIQEAIKKVGTYKVTLNLGEGVSSELPIEIVEKK